jgi:hypothetical protein
VNGRQREQTRARYPDSADYSAEMVGQIARFPRARDRALFVGEPGDVTGGSFGPDLPGIREWTGQNYPFPKYVTGFEPVPVRAWRCGRTSPGFTATRSAITSSRTSTSGTGSNGTPRPGPRR